MRSSLLGFAGRRALSAAMLIVVVSSGALMLVRLAPGDATTELALAHVDAATLAATRARLGLDRPIGAQFVEWVGGLVRFDLGESSMFGRPVSELVGERAVNTAKLASVALGFALAIGIPLGLVTGSKPRGLCATCVAPLSIALVACPPIVGVLLMMVLAIHTQWFSLAPGAIMLPAISLALPIAAMIERVQSRATAEVVATPTWNSAAARGIPTWRLLWIHAARQASRPVLGLFGVILGSLFSGSLAVEWVTSWPGLGRLMYDAIVGRDVFLVAGCALAGAVLVAAGNFIADLLRGVADPQGDRVVVTNRGSSVKKRIGLTILALMAGLAAVAPLASPNDPDTQFPDRAYAPPTRVHLWDAGGLHAPFIYQQRLQDRLLRDYRDDPAVRVPLEWWSRGRLWSLNERSGPLLLLGADSLGRDIFARLVNGARLSLGVALLGVAGALLLGAVVGGLAGSVGGRTDAWLMGLTDLFLVLPGAYLVLALRGVLPLRLPTVTVFAIMSGLFAVAAWPHVARGVRAIVATERTRAYAEASRAAGAGPFRQLQNLLPAARGFLAVQTILLLPALIVAEATISILGLGFPPPTASWGSMLQEAANVSVLAGAPWTLSPAMAMFLVALGVHLVSEVDAPGIDRLRSQAGALVDSHGPRR